MPVIDAHTHVFPDAVAPAAVQTLSGKDGVRAYYDGTVAGLLAMMERSGVSHSVIAPVATKPSQVESINDWVTGIADPRIIPFGAMHPDFSDPAGEIARLASLGVRGIKLHSQNQGFSPEEERMAPIYEAIVQHDMLVLFHAGGFVLNTGTEAHPAAFAAMLDRWPELSCILAHLGGYRCWDEVRRYLVGRDVLLDTAYVPGNLPDAEIVSIIREHGADRVLFGSDGPWTDVGREIEHLQRIGLTEAELEAILFVNAFRRLVAE